MTKINTMTPVEGNVEASPRAATIAFFQKLTRALRASDGSRGFRE